MSKSTKSNCRNQKPKMSDRKRDSFSRIMDAIALWILKLLWRFVRGLALTVYYRCLPDQMQMAPSEDDIKKFYQSKAWYRLALETKNKYRTARGLECMKCFKSTESKPGLKIVTDHIEPIRYYWHRRKDPNNLQILCEGCNKAKGSVDKTDYRGYRPGKTPLPATTPVPRRQLQIAPTYHFRERGFE